MRRLKRIVAAKLDSAAGLLTIIRDDHDEHVDADPSEPVLEDARLDLDTTYYVLDAKNAPFDNWVAEFSDLAFKVICFPLAGMGIEDSRLPGLSEQGTANGSSTPRKAFKRFTAHVSDLPRDDERRKTWRESGHLAPGKLPDDDGWNATWIRAREFARQLTIENAPTGELFLANLLRWNVGDMHVFLTGIPAVDRNVPVEASKYALSEIIGKHHPDDHGEYVDTYFQLVYALISYVEDIRFLKYKIVDQYVFPEFGFGARRRGDRDTVIRNLDLVKDLAHCDGKWFHELMVRDGEFMARPGEECRVLDAHFEALLFRRHDTSEESADLMFYLMNQMQDYHFDLPKQTGSQPRLIAHQMESIWCSISHPLWNPWILCDPRIISAISPLILNQVYRGVDHSPVGSYGQNIISGLICALEFLTLDVEEWNSRAPRPIYSGPRYFADTGLVDSTGREHNYPLKTILQSPNLSLDVLTGSFKHVRRFSTPKKDHVRKPDALSLFTWCRDFVSSIVSRWTVEGPSRYQMDERWFTPLSLIDEILADIADCGDCADEILANCPDCAASTRFSFSPIVPTSRSELGPSLSPWVCQRR